MKKPWKLISTLFASSTHEAFTGKVFVSRLFLTLLLIMGLGSNVFLARPLQADETAKNILILFSYNSDLPWQKSVIQGLNEHLAQRDRKIPINVFTEDLDSIRLKPGASATTWVKYLQDKYHTINFDMLISESAEAGRFLDLHPELFPSAQRYMVQPGRGTVARHLNTALLFHEDMYSCMKVALDLRPHSKHLIVIGNHDPEMVKRSQQVWETHFKTRVSYESWTEGFSFEELYQSAESLSNDTTILYLLVNHDKTNTKVYPFSVAHELSKRASVPVFACYDSLMGSGIVGGYLLSASRVGWAIADLITGARPGDFSSDFFSAYEFDAHELERWKIAENLLPANSTIMFQTSSFWQEHQLAIILIILFIIGETILIVALTEALRAKQRTQKHLEERVEERTAELKAANKQLSELSSHDELTHLANRREFNKVLANEFQRHTRTKEPLSLIMLDVDFFKNYNDSYGHVAGDQCLSRLAETIADCAQRPSDLAVRYGGEEFAVLLPDTDAEGAHKIALCIQEQLAELNIPHNRSNVADHVTVSIGVVSIRVSISDNTTDIINLADELLYRAKSEGRNRICSSGPETELARIRPRE